MDWLFDNLGKLAPVVVFIIYMLSSVFGKKEEEREVDPEAAERSRKIQEEIRRKILERQRELQPQAREMVEEEPEDFSGQEWNGPDQEETDDWQPYPPRPTYQEPESPAPVVVEAPSPGPLDRLQEKRREVEAKLAEAKRAKEAALKKAASIRKPVYGAKVKPVPRGAAFAGLMKGLGNPSSLQTSILVKEVLDKPIGLR